MRVVECLAVLLAFLALTGPEIGFGDSSPDGVVHTRVAFVTAVRGPAVFGDWDEASEGTTGLEAADSICQNLASSAGLLSPVDFLAWLSDSTDDAYCHIHNLSGKLSDNCGLGTAPATAGPWVRTDGAPWMELPNFAGSDLEVVYTPMRYDENGDPVPLTPGTPLTVWTGTFATGEGQPNPCSDWTATPAETAITGVINRTGTSWGSDVFANCQSAERHLYCLESGSGPDLDLQQPPGRIAFITSALGSSVLSTWSQAEPGTEGLAAGDSICNNEAANSLLPEVGSYKAWLSDASTHARDRFVNDGPWYTADGVLVADSLADLTDGELLAPVNQLFYTSVRIWTGTDHLGMRVGDDHCNSWTAGGIFGRSGRANFIGADWTSAATSGCGNMNYHLYCLSDALPGLSYQDGFEGQ